MNASLRFVKRKKYWLVALAVILTLSAYFYLSSRAKAPLNYIAVARGDIVSEVNVTGKVKPAESLDLAFEKSSRILTIPIKVGSKVKLGEILATLDSSELYAELGQARAGLKSEKAKLDELKSGTREEDVRVTQSELGKAWQDLANYYSATPDTLNDAYIKADDSVRQQTYQFFVNPEQLNPQMTFQTSNSQIDTDFSLKRYTAGQALNNWRNDLSKISSDASVSAPDLDSDLQRTDLHIAVVRSYLDKAMEAVTNAIGLTPATLTSYKSQLLTGRSELSTAATNVNSLEQNIASQKAVIQKIQDELNLKLAGAIPEQIAGQEAKVEGAEANVNYYETQIRKTVLRAPFSGTVTKIALDPGDIPQVNESVVFLIGNGAFQIEANIAESDIAKVKIGDSANVTLDAYGSEVVFKARVIQIDLGATTIEGVSTYKTTLEFLNQDPRILEGFTANVDILSDKKSNVLRVPTRNVETEGGKKFVQLVKDEKNRIAEKVEIKTGLRGSDGQIEVVSGLKEGDRVVAD